MQNAQAARGTSTKMEKLVAFQRLKPPKFNGTMKLLGVKAWLAEMEKRFESLVSTNAEKVHFAIFMLQGSAHE